MSNTVKTRERDLLQPYEDLYPRAVERIAVALRPRFESGELRGWRDGDGELGIHVPGEPPSFKIEDECARRWVTTPVRAIAVLSISPNAETVTTWEFKGSGGGQPLRGAAVETMALDVIAFARAQGWTKRQRGEMTAKLLRRAA
jgi:hypothetical protein